MSKPVSKNTNPTLKLTAYSLVVALMFSFSAEALHLFSHSDHIHCTETGTTHFHQMDMECEIFDFHLTPVLSFFETIHKPQFISNFKTIFPPVEENLSNKTAFQVQLRGPPRSI